MVALVDCNNFFVSVERVFEPHLQHQPVAVLSSNDGCIIARSNEVKAMGAPMGVPVFKVKELLNQHRVVLKSSNFALYSDMSRRVMDTLGRFSPDVDVYSIDEAFIDIPDFINLKDMRETVLRDTGIPVSIGAASTRTLAKAAAHLAKRNDGVMDFGNMSETEVDIRLMCVPVEEVWGVGRRLSEEFRAYRVQTAYDLKTIPDSLLRRYNVTVRSMVGEIRGHTAARVASEHSKSMISTRSFGKPVGSMTDLQESLSSHAAQLGKKLRREGLKTQHIQAFISTGKKGRSFHSTRGLLVATDDTREIIKAVNDILRQVYYPGLQYKKAGVMACKLSPAQQLSFNSSEYNLNYADKVNGVLDKVNDRRGSGSIRFAAEGFDQTWGPKHDLRSPRYTTEWGELKEVI